MKIEKDRQRPISLIQDDWDKLIWNHEMFTRHENELKKIDKEYQEIFEKCPSPVMTRWYWLESKKAVKIKHYLGRLEPYVNTDIYVRYDNIFTKYCDWKARQGQKPSVEEIRQQVNSVKESYENLYKDKILIDRKTDKNLDKDELNLFVEDLKEVEEDILNKLS